MGECVWAEPGKMVRILTSRERRGNFKWKKKKKKKNLWKKRDSDSPCLSPKYSILLPGPHVWPSLTITTVFSPVFVVVVQLILLNCDAGEDSWESLGLQGDKTSESARKSILNIHWKDWCWSWNSNTLTTWCEERTHLKRPSCWKRWKAGKQTTEDEMVGWHHRLNGHEFEWTPGVGDGQGSLACCSPWSHKESDTTEWLNWTEPHFSNMRVLQFHVIP